MTITFLLEEIVVILGLDHMRRSGGFWSRDLWEISPGQFLNDAAWVALSLLSADWWHARDQSELGS